MGSGPGKQQKKFGDPLHIFATVDANNFKFGTHKFGTQIWFGTSLPKNNVLDQNWRGSGPGEHPKKIWDPYIFLQPLKPATSNLVHKLGLGLAYQKTTFWTKIGEGLGQGSIQKNFGTPYVFLQPLKPSTSNLVHKFGLGLAYQETAFRSKIGGVFASGASQKNWNLLLISATIEASNFKFSTQLAFGTSLPKTTFWTKIGGCLGQRSIQKVGTPYLFLQPLKLATEKLVHNMSSGLPSQTQALGRV